MEDTMDVKNLKDALEFIEKTRFVPSTSNNNLIKSFIEAFSNLRQGIWELDEFDRHISVTLLAYPDLWNRFLTFRTDFESSSWDQLNPRSNGFEFWRPFCNKVLKLCSTSDQGAEFLKIFSDYSKIEKIDFQNRVENFLKEVPMELIDEFHNLLETQLPKLELEKSKKKKRRISLESELGSVLVEKRICCASRNKCFQDSVSVTLIKFDKERNFSIPTPKTLSPKSEEKMKKEFDDAMSILDFHLFWVRSAVQSLKKLSKLEDIEDIRKHLDNTHIRCITRLYASASEDVMERVSRNPERGVPVLVMRLEQRERELLEIRDELCIVQRKTGNNAEEYHHSSLDFLENYFSPEYSCITLA